MKHKPHMLKTYEIPKDGEQLRPKHVRALINKFKKFYKLVLNFIYVK